MTESPKDAAEERLQTYLDELLLSLRGQPRDARRLLSEVEEHLREAVAAGMAEGLDRAAAVDRAISRFGPPSAAARGLPLLPAYRAFLGQLVEAALLVVSLMGLAVGVAAVPTAVLGLAGNVDLVTGDPPGPNALATHHLEEVLRNHMLIGTLGFLALAAWWVLHVRRLTHPGVLPAGFALTICGSLLGALAVPTMALGIYDLARHINSTGGAIGPSDLVATGATVLAVALLCFAGLARQATRLAAHHLTMSSAAGNGLTR